MSQASFTFEVDEGLKNEFTKKAKACHVKAEDLLSTWMRHFVQKENMADALFDQEVAAGLLEADAGDLISDEVIEEEARLWRAQLPPVTV